MMKYILEKGSPKDYSDRLPKEQRCYELLDRLGLEYWRFVGCHPCINTSSLKLYKDDIFGPIVREIHHEPVIVKLIGEEA